MEYKAYSFDLDDNLLKLPTKVLLKNKDQKIVELTTLEFEEIRPNLKELGFEILPSSFSGFLNNEQFLEEIEKSTKAGSWKNLENCIIHHSSIFAIITSRGHDPETLKKAIKLAILKNFSKEQLETFSKNFKEKYNLNEDNQEKLLDIYLGFCKFYPVNNPLIQEKFNSKDTSELKSFCFKEFQSYVKEFVKNNFGEEVNVKIGFSDDSLAHLNKMINDILKENGLFFYQTKEEGKVRLG
jgi:hypothetical protein